MDLTENGLVSKKHIFNYFGKGVDAAKRALLIKKDMHFIRGLISAQLAKQKAHMISGKAGGMAGGGGAYILAIQPISPSNFSNLLLLRNT